MEKKTQKNKKIALKSGDNKMLQSITFKFILNGAALPGCVTEAACVNILNEGIMNGCFHCRILLYRDHSLSNEK